MAMAMEMEMVNKSLKASNAIMGEAASA